MYIGIKCWVTYLQCFLFFLSMCVCSWCVFTDWGGHPTLPPVWWAAVISSGPHQVQACVESLGGLSPWPGVLAGSVNPPSICFTVLLDLSVVFWSPFFLFFFFSFPICSIPYCALPDWTLDGGHVTSYKLPSLPSGFTMWPYSKVKL